MNTESVRTSPEWPCTVEHIDAALFVRDAAGQCVPLSAFKRDCELRAAELRRAAEDEACAACIDWLRRLPGITSFFARQHSALQQPGPGARAL